MRGLDRSDANHISVLNPRQTGTYLTTMRPALVMPNGLGLVPFVHMHIQEQGAHSHDLSAGEHALFMSQTSTIFL